MLKNLRQQIRFSTELHASLTCPTGETFEGQAADLSLAGARFQGSRLPDLQTVAEKTRTSKDLAILQMDIPVFNAGQRSIPVVSRVISARTENDLCHVGLEFCSLADHDQMQLEQFLYTRFLEGEPAGVETT